MSTGNQRESKSTRKTENFLGKEVGGWAEKTFKPYAWIQTLFAVGERYGGDSRLPEQNARIRQLFARSLWLAW